LTYGIQLWGTASTSNIEILDLAHDSGVDRGCHEVSVTDPYGCILAFLDRSRYIFFQVAPQLYSRG
jgi:hypothetical protein